MASKPFIRAGVTYPSQYAYRKALAQRQGFSSVGSRARVVREEQQVARLTKPQQTARLRVLETLSLVRREKFSLSQALKVVGTSRRSLIKYGGSAVEREGQRLRVLPSDSLPRRMRVLSPGGVEFTTILSSREASLLGEYWANVRHYARTGDASGLEQFQGKHITVRGQRLPLITDTQAIRELVLQGELEFDDLYELG